MKFSSASSLYSRELAKSGVARLPEGNRTTIDWRCRLPMGSASVMAGRRVPGHDLHCIGKKVNALECILFS